MSSTMKKYTKKLFMVYKVSLDACSRGSKLIKFSGSSHPLKIATLGFLCTACHAPGTLSGGRSTATPRVIVLIIIKSNTIR